MIRLRLSAIKNEPLAQLDLTFHKKNSRKPNREWLAALIAMVWHSILKQKKFLYQSCNSIKNLIDMVENAAAATLKPQNLCRPLLSGDWIAIDARLVFFRKPSRSIHANATDIVPFFRNLLQILNRKSRKVLLIFPDSDSLPETPEARLIPIHARDFIKEIKKDPEKKGNIIFLSHPPLEFLFRIDLVKAGVIIFNDPAQLRALLAKFRINEQLKKTLEKIVSDSLLDGFKTVVPETIRGFFLAGPPVFFLLKKLAQIAGNDQEARFVFCGNFALPILNLFSQVVDPNRGIFSLVPKLEPLPIDSRQSTIVQISLGIEAQNPEMDHFYKNDPELINSRRNPNKYCELIVTLSQRHSLNYANFIDGMSLFVIELWAEIDSCKDSLSQTEEAFWLDEIEKYLEIVDESAT